MNLEKYKKHFVNVNLTIIDALNLLNKLPDNCILFVVNKKQELIGTITDGDIRRALLNGSKLDENIDNAYQQNPKYVYKNNIDFSYLLKLKKNRIKLIPITNNKKQIIDLIDFNIFETYLPLDVVMMAGGKGTRLLPLTEKKPKPMLQIGGKPIIEHNIDRLIKFGVKEIFISINYLGDQIEEYFKDGSMKEISINYLKEKKALGTIGSISLKDKYRNDVLLMNSDILTNIYHQMNIHLYL